MAQKQLSSRIGRDVAEHQPHALLGEDLFHLAGGGILSNLDTTLGQDVSAVHTLIQLHQGIVDLHRCHRGSAAARAAALEGDHDHPIGGVYDVDHSVVSVEDGLNWTH